MKIIIENITEWEKNDAQIEGDRSHGGSPESEVLRRLSYETRDKIESEWTKGLPFERDVDVELNVDGATDLGRDVRIYLDDVLAQYASEHCSGDYLQPTEFEGRIVA